MTAEFFTRPKHDFTRLGRVDGWLGRTLNGEIVFPGSVTGWPRNELIPLYFDLVP